MPITLKLTTRSPVHIGTGRELEAFEYLIHDGYFWRLHPDRLTMFLLEAAGNEAVDQFASWISQVAERLTTAPNNREQSRLRQSITIRNFLRHIAGQSNLEQRFLASLPELASYYMPTTQAHFRQLIREQLKTPDGKLYVPGSSLKGALRTCLLYQVLTEADKKTVNRWRQHFAEELKQLKKRKRKAQFLAKWLEQEVFFCGVRRREDISWGDAQYDLLKFLMVSDSTAVAPEENGMVLNVNLYLPGARPQPQAPPVEALGVDVALEARIGFEVQFFQTAWKLLQQKTQGMGKQIWIELPERFERLYGLSLKEAQALSTEELERRLLARVRTAVRNFSEALRTFEIQWCQRAERGTTSLLARQLQHFYDSLPDDAIRLGWGSGFAAVTAFLALRDELEWEETLEELLVARFPSRKISTDTFPRSRRMAPQRGVVPLALPLGWIALEWPEPAQTPARETAAANAPEEPLLLERIGPRSQNILAEVVDNTKMPFLIRVFVRGLESKTFRCGGARAQNLQIGQRLLVEVAEWDKRGNCPRMFRVQSLRVK
ncbi:MAG: type III-A CRISPR-associated RAMP protein Csm5 [Rhodothermus sp.]|nr:type III-A CRISPR-associated RAMP protein Csm5 [Rhodothermus sp.]